MYPIVQARRLNDTVILLEVQAPLIAKKTLPGQFIILRIDEHGERVPFTVATCDPQAGTVTIIVQMVGKTTRQLGTLQAGDSLLDFVGPLGKPTELEGIRNAAVVGGGLGNAIAWPQAKYLHAHGSKVDIIAGFRTRDLVILEEEMRASCDHLYVCTDDGTYGAKGFVTNVLEQRIGQGAGYDRVIAVGPLPMMKFVSRLTEKYHIPTIVSMNPIMVDGTGMCGGCRITVGGKTQFACVDGPDFDGHQVDFDEAIARLAAYKADEKRALDHWCRLTGERR